MRLMARQGNPFAGVASWPVRAYHSSSPHTLETMLRGTVPASAIGTPYGFFRDNGAYPYSDKDNVPVAVPIFVPLIIIIATNEFKATLGADSINSPRSRSRPLRKK